MNVSTYDLPAVTRGNAKWFLASSFLLGHLLGVWCSGSASDFYLSQMRAAVSGRVSIVGLLSCSLLTFLVSALAVYLGRRILLIPIAFTKAFLFSYTGYRLYLAWGQAGWLVTGLTMFSSLCSLPVLYWYWQRCLTVHSFEWPVFRLVLALLTAIGFVDFYWIVPFLIDIISF